MKTLFLLIAVLLLLPATAYSQTDDDTAAVLKTLQSWNRGWAESDATLAVQSVRRKRRLDECVVTAG